MSNRHDYFYKQNVTEAEFDDGFAEVENADRSMMLDQDLIGIFQGGVCEQHEGLADLTVDVSGPCYGYDDFGQRIYFPGPTQNVNCAVDSSSVSTAVAGAPNEKYVSIAVRFTRVLADPRVDGNSETVYFRRDESYEFVVTQGAEALVGTAVPPTLDPDALLLADVHLIFGQTQILDADLSIDRRQDTFALAGTPLEIRAGTPKQAVQAMLDALNAHVTGVTAAHPASAIAYAEVSAWADTTTLASVNVQDAIDEIVNDLGTGTAGTAKISGAANVPFSGAPFGLAAAPLDEQLAALNNRANPGSREISTSKVLDDDTYPDGQIVLNAASITLTLTTPATNKGRRISLIDKTGTLAVGAGVTLVRAAAEKIEGVAASYELATPGGRWFLECDGTDWYLFSC